MGHGQHKIKRKAEQIASNEALTLINENNYNVPFEKEINKPL